MMRFFKALRSKPQTAQLCCLSDGHPIVTDGRGRERIPKGERCMTGKEREMGAGGGGGGISISA